MADFTHLDRNGNAVMVDVTEKKMTRREATAEGYICISEECCKKVRNGSMEKGDVLSTARIAGIMGAKKNSELIPLCHILNLTSVTVDFEFCPKAEEGYKIRAVCTVKCKGVTGVEMEALTGVSIALLTVYDMCKAVDKRMMIGGICLLKKTGGKSGEFIR